MKNHKLIISALIILVVIAIGYCAFSNKPIRTTPNEVSTTPAPASMGKLNINVVCESALTYMTFPDGASADKFVAECKEGQHPDVIERYKAQMNLGDGAMI